MKPYLPGTINKCLISNWKGHYVLPYCISDGHILNLHYVLVHLDPFRESITFAIIPNMDYKPSRRYSAKARQWLTCLENQHHSIRHAKMGVKSLKSPYGGRLRLGIAFCYVMSHYDCYRRDCPALSVIRI